MFSIFIQAGVAVLFGAAAAAAGVSPNERWGRADEEIVRLAPEKIEALPAPIRQELARLGCTIPQPGEFEQPRNVISGRFLSPDRLDIAVLCSRNRISSILVFTAGSSLPVAELSEAADRNYLQVVDGNGRIGFSRELAVAPPQLIRRYHASYGGPEPPPLDHDGINEAFLEAASIVWYWHEGQWLRLTGAD